MKYGKIRIEDGNLIFSKHMMMNYLPCKDIIWAYKRKEGVEGGAQKQYSTSSLVIITRRKKRYQFEMTDREIQNCIQLMRALNPQMVTGFPQGSRIPMQSLPNTRDLGALETEDGRHILPKRLLCSGSLYHISITDQDMLTHEYHLSTVVDFRTRMECLEKPDTIIEGVQYHEIPIVDEETLGITRSGSPTELLRNFKEIPEEFMLKQYESLVHDEYSIKQYARFLDVLLHVKNGAVVFHSATGEDRTGVGTALLLFALGVPKETIRRDYMRSNPCLEDELKYMRRLYRADWPENSRKLADLKAFYQVKESYINTVFDVIEKENGGIERFLRKKLYLTPKASEELKKKYLI